MFTRTKFLLATLSVLCVLSIFAASASPAAAARPKAPGGVTITSATLSLYVTQAGGEIVQAHRITAPWTETGVTWNNFASSFDPAVAGQFVPLATGWITVDLTALVQAWVDGTYPNYGVYLAGANDFSFSEYHSSEYTTDVTLRPKLQICYQAGAGTACTTMQRPGAAQDGVADAGISQLFPNQNENVEPLFTGYVSGNQKQSLIRFGLGTLGDFVWQDTNNNGLQDSGEPGVGNVSVNLYQCGNPNTLLASTSTISPTGLYQFAGLVPGCYVIGFVKPFGDSFTIYQAGGGTNPLTDSNANQTTGLTSQINLAAEQIDLSWDAGLIAPPTAVTLSTFDARTTNDVPTVGTVAIPALLLVGLLGMVVVGIRKFRIQHT